MTLKRRGLVTACRLYLRTKVNCLRGAYDGNDSKSRYWQVQNYLVGAQYEIRGEESSVHIIAGDRREQLCKESEIRTNNLDILDLGLVPNPLIDQGLVTAGRTLSGDDGNGGWEYVKDGTVHRVTLENFEFAFPINAKTNFGNRYLFWQWRNSQNASYSALSVPTSTAVSMQSPN